MLRFHKLENFLFLFIPAYLYVIAVKFSFVCSRLRVWCQFHPHSSHQCAKNNYYTSDSLWKIWLVESIQSIHNSLWTWHDKCNICCRYYIYRSMSAWLLSPLECSPQKQNGRTLLFCELCEKCIIKQLLNLVFA